MSHAWNVSRSRSSTIGAVFFICYARAESFQNERKSKRPPANNTITCRYEQSSTLLFFGFDACYDGGIRRYATFWLVE